MKSFFRILFGSCFGVLLAFAVLILIGSLVVGSIVRQSQDSVKVRSNSVLKLELNYQIPEKTNNTGAALYNYSNDPYLGVHEIIDLIRAAGEDRNIKGIYLQMEQVSLGNVMAEDIRDAILAFRETGKFVYAYSGHYSYGQHAYYIASAADRIYLHPMGMVDFRGYSAMVPFFKGLLDKLDIKMETFYAGKFKGATEPFRLNELSDENKTQIKEYISDLYEDFLQDISRTRHISVQNLKTSANQLHGRNAQLALANGLVDVIAFEDEIFDQMRSDMDLSVDDPIHFISLTDFSTVHETTRNYRISDKIAVVYAEGEIRHGKESYGMIMDEPYMKILREIRRDDKIKGVVLRINSPGGDAFVSDIMWRELRLIRETGKPVTVSMGDLAASGGYYLACAADSIFAEENTLTGSIGVFGLVPNVEGFMNNKLGIHFDTVKTAKYSTGLYNAFYPISPEQAKYIQESVDSSYYLFLERVAESRNMGVEEVHEIAQGRVWTGKRALDIGLVDKVGCLEDAIQSAVNLAKLDEYRITEYPRIKDPIQKLFEDLFDQKIKTRSLLNFNSFIQPGEPIETLLHIARNNSPQARLPFLVQH